MEKNQLIVLDEIKVNSIPELQGWREKQEALVSENPFIKITDHKTYEQARKHRTALVKGRTEIQKQDRLVASKIKCFRDKVSKASTELIQITQSHEEKQQTEVKRYEKLKAQEKERKERLEAERKKGIKDEIYSIFKKWKLVISELEYNSLEGFSMLNVLSAIDTLKFEEYQADFDSKVEILNNLFQEKKQQLEVAEKQRLEDERLRKERQALDEERRIAREKVQKEEEEKRKEQERIDAENKRKANELARKEAKLEEEKKRLEKREADRKAKEEAEKVAREEAKRREEEEEKRRAEELEIQKRIEALRPDKEKLQKVIESISINESVPELRTDNAINFYNHLQNEIQKMKNTLSNSLLDLK